MSNGRSFAGPTDPRIIAAQAGRVGSPDNTTQGAQIAGLTLSAYRRALTWIDKNGKDPVDEDRVTMPVFPDPDVSAEQILDHMGKRFEQRVKHDAALKWFKIQIDTDKPIGLGLVGDPHMGSNGCNISLLRRDVSLLALTAGMHAINIGDTADNWGGRLIHLYSENDVSRETERRLARWFLKDSGVPWRVWLHGNHDMMNGEFSTYLKTINANEFPMLDWQAKFEIEFSNGSTYRSDLSHNHKGTSIYNKLHGQKRAALWHGGERADLYGAGHHHTAAVTQEETEDGRWIMLMRVRGYKWLDHFAVTHGFPNNQFGASGLVVIDPKADPGPARAMPFLDLETGCKYLEYRRENG